MLIGTIYVMFSDWLFALRTMFVYEDDILVEFKKDPFYTFWVISTKTFNCQMSVVVSANLFSDLFHTKMPHIPNGE